MTYTWDGKGNPEDYGLSERKVWRYYYDDNTPVNLYPRHIEPQAGILEKMDGYWMFYKLNKSGSKCKKGTFYLYDSRFSDSYEEAVEGYNNLIESVAKKYENASETAKENLIPAIPVSFEPTIYTYYDARDGVLTGMNVYHFRYIMRNRPSQRPYRIKPVKVRIRLTTHTLTYGTYTFVHTDHYNAFGEKAKKDYSAGTKDYFAKTYEEAVTAFNKLVYDEINAFKDKANEIREDKIK